MTYLRIKCAYLREQPCKCLEIQLFSPLDLFLSIDLLWERGKKHTHPSKDAELKLWSTPQDVGMTDIGDVRKPRRIPSQRNTGKDLHL